MQNRCLKKNRFASGIVARKQSGQSNDKNGYLFSVILTVLENVNPLSTPVMFTVAI